MALVDSGREAKNLRHRLKNKRLRKKPLQTGALAVFRALNAYAVPYALHGAVQFHGSSIAPMRAAMVLAREDR